MVIKNDNSVRLKNEVQDLVSSLGISNYRNPVFNGQSDSFQELSTDQSELNKSKAGGKQRRIKDNNIVTGGDGVSTFTDDSICSKQQKQQSGKQKQSAAKQKPARVSEQKENGGKQKQHKRWNDHCSPIKKNTEGGSKRTGESAWPSKLSDEERFEDAGSEESPNNVIPNQEHELWYEKLTAYPDHVGVEDPSLVSSLRQEASSIMECAATSFKKSGGGMPVSQWRWSAMVLTSGTLADKLAVRYTLLRRAPHLNLRLLDDTIKLVAAKGKSHSIVAMARLSSMFTEFLLPPDRILKPFARQPLSRLQQLNAEERQQHLMFWLLEDRVKVMYRQFVDRLRDMSHDTVEKIRKHSVVTMATLLTSRPEQEQTLLENLVNKIGDERRTICCLTVRKLSKLLRVHPAMRTVVVKEVERLLFRPNVGKRVQFYGVCFLSQVQLSNEGDEDLALRIIRIYIGFFKASVKQAELDDRLLRALLSGLTSCTCKCQLAISQLQEYTTPLYHIAQLSHNLSVVTQSLQLIFRLSSSKQASGIPPDRFYTLLYKKVFVGGLSVSAKLSDFLNLLFCAISVDDCDRRVRAFIKRLLQWSLQQSGELACAVLLMVAELLRLHPQQHTFLPPGTATPAPSAGTEHVWGRDEEDDMEELRDVDTSDEECEPTTNRTPVASGWTFTNPLHPPNTTTTATTAHSSHQYKLSAYSAQHRDPRWCRAELQPLHELILLQHHYHPTVALFARQLLNLPPPEGVHCGEERSSAAKYSGNPLVDFKLMRFLNRFCYRNPKRVVGDVSGAADSDGAGVSARGMAVTSPAYGRLPDSHVPSDERFFHRYFSKRQQQCDTSNERITDASGNITDSAFEQYIEQLCDGGSSRSRRKQKQQQEEEEQLTAADDWEEDELTDFAAEMTLPSKRQHKKDEFAEDDVDDDDGGDDHDEDEDDDDDDDDEIDGFSSGDDDDVPISSNNKRKLSQMALLSGDEFVPADQVNLESDDEQVPMMDHDFGDDGDVVSSGKASKGKRRQAQWEESRSSKRGPRKRTAGKRHKHR